MMCCTSFVFMRICSAAKHGSAAARARSARSALFGFVLHTFKNMKLLLVILRFSLMCYTACVLMRIVSHFITYGFVATKHGFAAARAWIARSAWFGCFVSYVQQCEYFACNYFISNDVLHSVRAHENSFSFITCGFAATKLWNMKVALFPCVFIHSTLL